MTRIPGPLDPPGTGHPAKRPSGPPIDYLAKDYESFRAALLARIAAHSTGWTERSPIDLGIALVEVLAYAADLLSYHQDSVATEASLATARQRISVRRHARLLDYVLSEGCNARAWVCFRVDEKVTLAGPEDHKGTVPQLTTGAGAGSVALPEKDLPHLLSTGTQVFAPMHGATLRPGYHEIPVAEVRSATQAILCDPEFELVELAAGDVLVFEDQSGPERRCHPVRLTQVLWTRPGRVEVSWHAEDALPFPLSSNTAVARGNVVLVDHGRLVKDECLGTVPETGRFQPVLSQFPLTWRSMVGDGSGGEVPFDPEASAASALRCDPAGALPDIKIRTLGTDGKEEECLTWIPRHDLLDSGPGDLHFVAEVRNDGRAQIRFGDDRHGRRPWKGSRLVADYRVGVGRIGNVGARSIRHVVGGSAVLSVSNPLPAAGGSDPVSIEEARIAAPASLQRQERGVTAKDLERLAARHPEVAAAHAELIWAGSWYVARVTVERTGGQPAGEAFLKGVRDFLEPYRLVGSEMEVHAGRYVPLEIEIRVWSYPAHPQGTVRAEILDALTTGITRWGSPGFFHPDRWPFRRPVRFSELARVVLGVAGVARLEPVRFRRHGAHAPLPLPVDGDLVIPLEGFERAQVPPGNLEVHVEPLP